MNDDDDDDDGDDDDDDDDGDDDDDDATTMTIMMIITTLRMGNVFISAAYNDICVAQKQNNTLIVPIFLSVRELIVWSNVVSTMPISSSRLIQKQQFVAFEW